MNPNWLRASKAHPCPICLKDGWCLLSKDGGAAICMRIAEGAWRVLANGGYLHRLRGGPLARSLPPRRPRRPVGDSTARGAQVDPLGQQAPPVDFERLQQECFNQLQECVLALFADHLRVEPWALSRLGIGLGLGDCYSFPMHDGGGRVIGLRLRNLVGQKWAIRGSRNGLFLEQQSQGDGVIFVCEGASDTAAMLGLSLEAVGVPGAGQCIDMLKVHLRRRDVVVMVDRDAAGERGANQTAAGLSRVCRSVRLLYPRRGKDVREWFALAHPTAEMVLAAARARRLY